MRDDGDSREHGDEPDHRRVRQRVFFAGAFHSHDTTIVNTAISTTSSGYSVVCVAASAVTHTTAAQSAQIVRIGSPGFPVSSYLSQFDETIRSELATISFS